jgi:hypothetical protein
MGRTLSGRIECVMRWLRKPTCVCCETLESQLVVFGAITICDECRLMVIEWMRMNGFSLARSHPFTDEFMRVNQPKAELGLKDACSRRL